MDFGERITHICEVEGWSNRAFAALAGVTPQNVGRWKLLAECDIKFEHAYKIERNAGYRMLWVTKGIGPMRTADKSDTLTVGEEELLDFVRKLPDDTDRQRVLPILKAALGQEIAPASAAVKSRR